MLSGQILKITCDGEIEYQQKNDNTAVVICNEIAGSGDISPSPTSIPDENNNNTTPSATPTSAPDMGGDDVMGTDFNGFVRGLHDSVPRPTAEQVERGVLECPRHDSNQYHALYDPIRNCHYDHEHGDDPSQLNDLFGSVSEWWGGDQSISYPWQTYAFEGSTSGGGDNYPARTGGFENDTKHVGYKWFVREGLPCESRFTDGCVTAFRSIDHGMGNSHGATTRFHSFAIEMIVYPESNPSDCGIVKTGGWQDKGALAIDGQILSGFGPRNGAARLHYFDQGNPAFGTWYGGTRIATSVIQFEDMWGPINPANPMDHSLFCPDYSCGSNSSKRQIHLVGAGLRGVEIRWLRQNGFVNSDGKVNFEGYTDRYGNINKDGSCTQASLDCVPLILENFTPMLYQYRGDAREYDSVPIGLNWIKHPN